MGKTASLAFFWSSVSSDSCLPDTCSNIFYGCQSSWFAYLPLLPDSSSCSTAFFSLLICMITSFFSWKHLGAYKSCVPAIISADNGPKPVSGSIIFPSNLPFRMFTCVICKKIYVFFSFSLLLQIVVTLRLFRKLESNCPKKHVFQASGSAFI